MDGMQASYYLKGVGEIYRGILALGVEADIADARLSLVAIVRQAQSYGFSFEHVAFCLGLTTDDLTLEVLSA